MVPGRETGIRELWLGKIGKIGKLPGRETGKVESWEKLRTRHREPANP